MRKLKKEKNIKINHEAVINIEIDKITNETNITVVSGYLDGTEFIPIEEGKKRYKIKGISEEQEELDYFDEVDKQNSPSLAVYGLLYRAKHEGVYILYSAKDTEENFSISVVDTTIEIKLDPLVTTNQEIIDAIKASFEALVLIYEPEVLDLSADVDTPAVPLLINSF